MEDTTEENKRLVHEIVMSNSVEQRLLSCAELFEAGKAFARIGMPPGLTDIEQKAFVFEKIYGATPLELSQGRWLRIAYGGFYDYPTEFGVEFGGRIYIFERYFDDELDDYPNEYEVYRCAEGASLANRHINTEGREFVGRIAVREIDFDPDNRHCINARVFTKLALDEGK